MPKSKKRKKLNSRVKGAEGELELSHFLKFHGFAASRGQQHSGSPDSPDVKCPELDWVHFECKRVETGSLYKWLEQAKRDAGVDKIPVVAHRKNYENWVAVLPLAILLELFHKVR